WMMRDYRANVNSRKNSVHLKSTSAYYNSLRWIQFEQRIASFQKQHPNHVLIVRYEDLVQAPDHWLIKVCEFLEIPVKLETQEALAPYQALFQREVKTQYEKAERMKKRFGDLSKPIHTAAVESWKAGLSTQEIEVCEVIAGKQGRTYGYHTTLTIPIAKRCWILALAMPYAVKISLERAKDALFNRLPIRLKVIYFERWVLRIDKKRMNHVA
ncbi:MAG: Sulfotransferase family, partial [Bacteroidota bacterium]